MKTHIEMLELQHDQLDAVCAHITIAMKRCGQPAHDALNFARRQLRGTQRDINQRIAADAIPRTSR